LCIVLADVSSVVMPATPARCVITISNYCLARGHEEFSATMEY
jgi:hypothetical protein